MSRMRNVLEYLEQSAERFPEKSAVTDGICTYTYKELLDFDFGSWFSEEFENEKIVLFEDFMKEVSSKDLILAIELKEEGIEKETLEIIKKYYNKANVFITSFIYNALLNVRKLDKTIKIGWLIKEDINQKGMVYRKLATIVGLIIGIILI